MLPALSDPQVAWDTLPFSPPTLRRAARNALVRAIGERATTRIVAEMRRSVPADAESGTPPDPKSPLGRKGAWLREHGIDLMLYPAPTAISFECGVPYVMAIHDLQHRLQPEFPEVSADGEWQAREYLFSNAVRMAQAVIVDSEVGREDVLEHYGGSIAPERVRVLPFVPPPYLARPRGDQVSRVHATYDLPDRYLLFPAQFWPHKNHRRVVEAVAALHHDGLDVTVVLTGSAGGRLRVAVMDEISSLIRSEGIEHLVRVLGYVDDETIASLYAGATGLVLPTFFGPTNIPVVEAWSMGIPVLTSDIRGIREQCGDAALLVDPSSSEAIADGIRLLWGDEQLRRDLIAAGAKRLGGQDLKAFARGLGSILGDVADSLPARAGQPVAR